MNKLKKLSKNHINFLTICCSRITQLSNFQGKVSVLFKNEQPIPELKNTKKFCSLV